MEAVRGTVRQAIEETINGARVPGIVVMVARGQAPVEQLVVGNDASGQPLAVDSLFPVASITKLATALTVLRLVDQGALALDDPLWDHLPEAAAAQMGVTIRTLLCHTSGLPLDVSDREALYGPGLDWPALARACEHTPLEAPPDTRVQYSNAGYGLLAMIVERQTGRDFASALGTLVLDPLGIEGYLGVEPPRQPAVVADVRGAHKGTDLEPFNSAFWRSLALPWAGMLTTASGALRLVRAFAGTPSDFLRPETRAEATRNQAGDLGGGFVAPLIWPRCPWGLGPDIHGDKTPHWVPAQANPDSYGHSGASGCVAWFDPAADTAWVVLGARTADSGWLLRRGAGISTAILDARPLEA